MAAFSNTAEPHCNQQNDFAGLKIVLPALDASEQVNPIRNAFDAIVPYKTTFDTYSYGKKHISYDVFINHHGKDVKHTLASSIYNPLNAMGMRVFLDKDELKHGDFFPGVIEAAIRSASLHIAIFSEHYAESPWCLAELASMVETRKTIIPVFYHVDPSDLRWAIKRKGRYANAFAEHEEKKRYSPRELQRWKEALQFVSFYHGSVIPKKNVPRAWWNVLQALWMESNVDDEQRAVKNVVNRVIKEMKKERLHVADHPVGLDEAVRNFDAFQSAALVNFIGIWGMGGSGKTTLAKEIFNRRSSNMDWFSFVSDVRDAAGKGQLIEKQKKLLKDLDDKDPCFDNLDEGKQILKNHLSRSVSVLIVLDDVDHRDQLDALLPPKESLGEQSLIIVTTRNAIVLQQWGISAIYQMRPLNANHAKQLFCWHAFLKNSSPSEFEDLVEMFLNACKGLPLSLKVLGGHLYGKSNKDYWQRTINKFSQIPHEDIAKRLKVSYDALGKQDKEMFLDAACLFIGQRKSAAIAAWDAEKNWDGLLGWETLFNKCLVDEDEDGLIRMHDQLRDLGRDIANGQSPYRLWSPEQVIEIHPQQEAIRVRGMTNVVGDNCYQQQGKIIINTSEGKRSLMPCSLGLKFFLANGGFINQTHSEISRELVWFQCQGFEHKNVPSWLSLKNLRVLEFLNTENLEYLWELDTEVPLQLRELVIQPYHDSLPEFPRSMGLLKNMKKILISDGIGNCGRHFVLPQEFCLLESLEHLEIKWCGTLTSLPSNFGKLINLQYLSLNGCRKLKELPDSFKKLTLLEYLSLYGCSELTIKSELHVLENMTKLRYLNLEKCMKLEELCLPQVASLRELYLTKTSLKELPANIIQLTKLAKLQIGSKFLTTLPNFIGNLPSLSELEIKGCHNLEALPNSFKNLSSLTKLVLRECHNLKLLPISFQNLSSLIELEIDRCYNLEILPTSHLETLPVSLGNLSSLTTFKLKWCQKLEALPDPLEHLDFLVDLLIEGSGLKCLPKSLIHLKRLRVLYTPISELSFESGSMVEEIHLACTNVSKISICGDYCRFLKALHLVDNRDLRELETLPARLKTIEVINCHVLNDIRGVCGLRKLQHLWIYQCEGLEGLPYFGELVSLQTFALTSSKVKKIEGLEHIKSLQMLGLFNCPELDELQCLGEVAYLQLVTCPKLERIIIWSEKLKANDRPRLGARPNLPEISSLNYFHLEKCHKLKKIEGLESIRSLEALHIHDCPELYELPSLSQLTYLEEFKLYMCHKLEKIEGLENIQSLKKLMIYGCPELDGLPNLGGLSYLEEFELQIFNKLEKIEGLENMQSLKKLRILYDCPELDGLPNLAGLICLKVEPFISKMQKWPREVIIRTRAMCDVALLKNFFEEVPNVSLVDYERESIERELSGRLHLRRPESSANANAIMICLIINSLYPDLLCFNIKPSEGHDLDSFVCKVGKGKWVWMGVFTEASEWFGSNKVCISTLNSEEENVKVEVEAAWSVIGEEGSIVEAFRNLWKSDFS